KNAPQHFLVELYGGGLGPVLLDGNEIGEAVAQFPRRQYEIDHSRRNRATRHRGILCLLWILDQNEATGFLHCLDADSPVRSGTTEDHGKAVAEPLGKRAEEHVDRAALSAWLVEFQRGDLVIDELKATIWWDDIDVIGLQLLIVFYFHDRHV